MLLVAEVDAGRQLTTRPDGGGGGGAGYTPEREGFIAATAPRLQESKVARAVCAESAEV